MGKIIWVIPVLPFISFLIIIFFTFGRRALSTAISIFAISTAFLLSLLTLITYLSQHAKIPLLKEYKLLWSTFVGYTIEIGYLQDPLSIFMLVVVSLVSCLVQIYSIGYMKKDTGISRYFAFMSLFASSMLALSIVSNFLLIYVFWELVGLCSYLLIGFWYHKEEAAKAGIKAFITTRIGDVGLLIAILLLFWQFGTFNLVEIRNHIGILSEVSLSIICILIFLGCVGKSAQFPLHVWLPDAMEGPTPVSALIHAATMVAAGVFLVARCSFLFENSVSSSLIVANIGGFTALFAATMAIGQSDIKRILAYSTISQLGYMMSACGLLGYDKALFHLMTHAFFKALLFLSVGCVIHFMHTNDIWQMGGLRKKMPITWLCFLVGAGSLAGLPPTSGFFSKDQIIHLGLHEKNIPILFFTIATVFVTAFYIFKLYFVVFEGRPRKEEKKEIEHKDKKEAANVMLVPICILAFLSLFAGLLGNLFFKFINPSFTITTLHKHYHYHHPSGIEFDIKLAAISCILAVLGVICAWVVYKGKRTDPYKEKAKLFPLLENKYYIDELYQFLFINPALKLKNISLLFDLKFIDGIVNGIAKLTKGLGKALATLQTGLVNNYLLTMVIIFLIILLTKLIGG